VELREPDDGALETALEIVAHGAVEGLRAFVLGQRHTSQLAGAAGVTAA
jgi:hypothetical protein